MPTGHYPQIMSNQRLHHRITDIAKRLCGFVALWFVFFEKIGNAKAFDLEFNLAVNFCLQHK